MHDRWEIFSVSKERTYFLIREICHEKYEEMPELFDYPIGIYNINDSGYLNNNSLLKENNWNDFIKEIKTNNRFHIDMFNKNVLNEFCEYAARIINKGLIFYRARNSTIGGFSISEMGSPPQEKASAGRVNPIGIRCLYLSNDKETTLHEIRAGALDYVTIGEFKLKQNIKVIDFTTMDKTSPFQVQDIKKYAVNKNGRR